MHGKFLFALMWLAAASSAATEFESSLVERPQPWQRRSQPVLSASTTKQEWSRVVCYSPHVIWHDGRFRMWYLGTSTGSRSSDMALGYAESTDGIEWIEHSNNPILTPADLPWGRTWQTPSVLFDEGASEFKMWFVSGEVQRDPQGRVTTNDQRLGYATSVNGVDWQIHPTMIYPSGRSPSVIKEAPDRYRMWMGSRPDLEDRVSSDLYANIYEFSSTDGIRWKRSSKPVLRPTGPARSTVYPYVFQRAGTYYMWHGCHVDGGRFEIFCAQSADGKRWEVDHTQPAFGAADGKSLFDSRYTSTPCIVPRHDRLLMYYSARDWKTEYLDNLGRTQRDSAGVYAHIGVAELPISAGNQAAESKPPDDDCSSVEDPVVDERRPDVVIVGAGISGLSAALEIGRAGGEVLLVDMSSVYGGHAVMSQGGVSIVGTPLQASAGQHDNAKLAYDDFIRWGEDADVDWVRYYVENSRREIYDWLLDLGVRFESVESAPGNSVDRFHQPAGRGIALVTPIYRECLQLDNIQFRWNTQAVQLIRERGRVVGVVVRDLRAGDETELRAGAVVLATGGFQSNLDMVRQYWPQEFRFPARILVGSGHNSVGRGHELARRVGADLVRMDHQWNYFTGIPDLRYPGTNRGLSAANMYGIIVNSEGQRFANLHQWAKEVMPALLRQPRATLWFVFDEATKPEFVVSGTDWADFEKVDRLILQNPKLVHSADTLVELARKANLPPENLKLTIDRYNLLVEQGEDLDFERFGPGRSSFSNMASPPLKTPPYYAMQAYPLTRKSMGGVAIDLACRVVNKDREPIPGLYAVGELTGLAGINGKAALEGTFLGPCIVTGRVAGRSIANALHRGRNEVSDAGQKCVSCHDMKALLAEPRPGYWHFEKSHAVALKRGTDCRQCHAELAPYQAEQHVMDQRILTTSCVRCHVAQE